MKNELEDLILTLKKLRSPNGCDWDKSQTHKSLIPYLLEETYEVIEAIQENNMELMIYAFEIDPNHIHLEREVFLEL